MDTELCFEALDEAMAKFGRPEIFNTGTTIGSALAHQGSQFTSPRFTGRLLDTGVKVSMDVRGRWMDNVLSASRSLRSIERLWRSAKYECVYLHAYETGSEARAWIGKWVDHYNTRRPYSALNGRTPAEAHEGFRGDKLTA